MSHWNNRVFKKFVKYPESMSDVGEGGLGGEWTFSIRETYYNDNGDITMYSDEPRPAFGETLDGLKWSLERMLEACDKEVLDVDTIVLAKNDYDDIEDDDDELDDNFEDES